MGRRFRKELESNETVKLDVLGFIKQPHAAPAELLDDAVVGDSLAFERLGHRHVAVILGCKPNGVKGWKVAGFQRSRAARFENCSFPDSFRAMISPVSWLTICPLVRPEKAIGHESRIELWSPLERVLLCWFRN